MVSTTLVLGCLKFYLFDFWFNLFNMDLSPGKSVSLVESGLSVLRFLLNFTSCLGSWPVLLFGNMVGIHVLVFYCPLFLACLFMHNPGLLWTGKGTVSHTCCWLLPPAVHLWECLKCQYFGLVCYHLHASPPPSAMHSHLQISNSLWAWQIKF